jgi:NitT/TauT family transport system ATP-binding protein
MSANERTLSPVPVPPPGVAKILLRDVTKTYATARGELVPALGGIGFEVREAEFVCLLGPSGSGKSTVLNLIAGLERADSGEVLVGGVPVTAPGPERALLFQDPALFPWMSVLGNVDFALEMIGIRSRGERRDRAMSWLSKVHMRRFADAQPHELSAGMRQRAALARALACRPDVLLADEPFAALDAQTRELLQRELQDAWQETRTTLVFVTHNVREAVLLADRVLLMSASPGRVLQEYRISAPRPRRLDDALVAHVIADVHAELDREVEIVVERETGERTALA